MHATQRRAFLRESSVFAGQFLAFRLNITIKAPIHRPDKPVMRVNGERRLEVNFAGQCICELLLVIRPFTATNQVITRNANRGSPGWRLIYFSRMRYKLSRRPRQKPPRARARNETWLVTSHYDNLELRKLYRSVTRASSLSRISSFTSAYRLCIPIKHDCRVLTLSFGDGTKSV